MLHACVQRFDETENLEKFCKILGTKRALAQLSSSQERMASSTSMDATTHHCHSIMQTARIRLKTQLASRTDGDFNHKHTQILLQFDGFKQDQRLLALPLASPSVLAANPTREIHSSSNLWWQLAGSGSPQVRLSEAHHTIWASIHYYDVPPSAEHWQQRRKMCQTTTLHPTKNWIRHKYHTHYYSAVCTIQMQKVPPPPSAPHKAKRILTSSTASYMVQGSLLKHSQSHKTVTWRLGMELKTELAWSWSGGWWVKTRNTSDPAGEQH